jgi:hypothetical protein
MGSKHFRCLKFGEQICGFPFRANQLTVASRKNPALFPAFSGKMKNGFRPKYI